MPSSAPDAPATDASPPARRTHARRALRWLGALGVVLALLAFFPWDWLRGPINRYVTQRTGRHFAITRHLDVHLGRVSTVELDGLEFANPDWARERWLLRAEGAQLQVRLAPLLRGRIELPRVQLRSPSFGLQRLTDGRKTWALDPQASQDNKVAVGELQVDRGRLTYLDTGQRIDLVAEVALQAESASPLPLSFQGQGQWRGEAFKMQGRSGGLLRLSEQPQAAFPLELEFSAGQTQLKAQGRVTHLAELAGVEAKFSLQGRNLAQLFELAGLALPSSPPYRLEGQLHKRGQVWQLQGLQGHLGRSDFAGELRLDRGRPVPWLGGRLHAQRLDLADLGPMVGWRPTPPASARSPGRRPRQGRLLPDKPLALPRLHTLDADLTLSAARIQNAPRWPLESLRAQVQLKEGRLHLEPLQLGLAGGQLAGQLVLDARARVPQLDLRLEARQLQLNRLLPSVASRGSLGMLGGQVRLAGAGASVAQWLGGASGEIKLLMGRGRISNLLLEFMGLDGGEIIKFLLRGDAVIPLRCAAMAFDVQRGRMDSRVILLDTVDTVIHGQGRINLGDESLDLRFEPEPKDTSILSLRTPLRITGTFGAPEVGPEAGALAGRVGLAAALAAINPLLGLAATVETGPGQNADCSAVLKKAAAPRGSAPARR